VKTASCACRTTFYCAIPRSTVLHNATAVTTDRLSLSCQPAWLVIGYGGVWWSMVD